MLAIPRSQLVWVRFAVATTRGTKLPFQDQPELNGNFVVGIESFNSGQLALVPDSFAVTTSLADWTLTLNEGSDSRFTDMPCTSLNALANGGVYKEFTPFLCDWQKSRVTYYGVDALDAPYAVPFNVYYFRPEDIREQEALFARLSAGQ